MVGFVGVDILFMDAESRKFSPIGKCTVFLFYCYYVIACAR